MLHRAMKIFLILFGFSILSSGCSNPFSSQRASILKENPKPTNTNCKEVRFDQSELTTTQLRAVIHCLNQNQELEEIEEWSQTVSDSEFSPWVIQFNSILKDEPEFLYALKEIYIDEQDRGEFKNLITQLLSKLQPQDQKNKLIHLLKNHSPWIRNFIANSNYKINLQNLTLLSEVKSFNRSIQEQYKTENINSILQAIDRYHQQPNALSFQQIFKLFSKASASYVFNKKNAEKIAGFIHWIFKDGRIDTFSRAAEALETKPITCFDQGKTIKNPLHTLLGEFINLNPSEISSYINKNVPAIFLLGQGYCQLPPELSPAVKLLQLSTTQDSLPVFFKFIQPLLVDQNFALLLSSPSFRELAKVFSKDSTAHLFQDLFPLLNWVQNNPILESNTAEVIDSVFNEFDSSELSFILSILPENESFYRATKKILLSLPKLQKTKNNFVHQDWLSPFTKTSFSNVLSLISKMNAEDKVAPILDRLILLFQKFLDRGKLSYHPLVIGDAKHSSASDSQTWLFPFLKNTPPVQNQASSCTEIPLEINFLKKAPNVSSSLYLDGLEKLSRCYGVNQSFLSIKDLASYLMQRDSSTQLFSKFSSLQEHMMNFIFAGDADQAIRSFYQVIKLNQDDLIQMHQLMKAGSALLSSTKNQLYTSLEIRKLLSKYTSQQQSYEAILKQNAFSNDPTSTPYDLKPQLISFVLKNLPMLFERYCPSHDQNNGDCSIEADQVDQYQKSPRSLAEKIASEYVLTPQTWLHPLETKEWATTSLIPKNVSTIEYHLNPLLKQLEDNPASIMSIFDFMKRNEKSNFNLFSFLQRDSQKFYLIPYLFQHGTFPNSNHEFHSLIRLRIVSDIDRLELLAINADFMAFGVMKNFGMSFIQEIATSWGDVPAAKRPKLGRSETLAEARASILQQFSKFNSGLLQRIGSCNPRGKNPFGHWLQTQLCNGELRDIRARMFNLNWMLSILDDPQVLELLRDLFYSIYEHNSLSQFGRYSNGIKNVGECVSPTTNKDQCSEDLLEIIPKIARLGLLHQAGLAITNENTKLTKSVLSILSQANLEKKDREFSSFLANKNGQNLIREILSLTLSLDPKEVGNISILTQNLAALKNQEWLSFLLKIYEKNPKLLTTFSSVIHSALQKIQFTDLTPEMNSLLSSVSLDLKNDQLLNESSAFINSIRSSQGELQSILDIHFQENLAEPWLHLLSKAENQKLRDQLSSFIISRSFDDFCDVFSDAQTIEKTYKFLDASNQNSGVLELLEECGRFLH